MSRSNLEINFWLDVQRELETVYGQTTDQARWGIDGYRQRLAQHEAIEAVYHSEPRDIAKAIFGGRFRQDPARG
jgi:hypothetical protein